MFCACVISKLQHTVSLQFKHRLLHFSPCFLQLQTLDLQPVSQRQELFFKYQTEREPRLCSAIATFHPRLSSPTEWHHNRFPSIFAAVNTIYIYFVSLLPLLAEYFGVGTLLSLNILRIADNDDYSMIRCLFRDTTEIILYPLFAIISLSAFAS